MGEGHQSQRISVIGQCVCAELSCLNHACESGWEGEKGGAIACIITPLVPVSHTLTCTHG